MSIPLVTEAKVPGHCAFHWPQFSHLRGPWLQEEIQRVLSQPDKQEDGVKIDYGSVGTLAGLKELYRSLVGLNDMEAVEKIVAAGDPYARRQWFRTLHGELCYREQCCR